jgi:hypothetical protein
VQEQEQGLGLEQGQELERKLGAVDWKRHWVVEDLT